jgi:hypothetical protein
VFMATTGSVARPDPNPATRTASRRVPLWVKAAYTAFLAVLIPYYWSAYGPTNFLYFCDVALFFALAALWTEKPLFASMPAVGILLPQLLWCVDFLGGMVGWPVVGMTAYMFNPELSLLTRGLSFFHFWLPFLLVWLVWRLGYDRRAFWAWTVTAWALILVCYLWMPAPPPSPEAPNVPVNINYVYGFSDAKAQEWMDPRLYVAVLMVVLPVCVFLPTHWLLKGAFGRREESYASAFAEV